jgi:hypothetical protein
MSLCASFFVRHLSESCDIVDLMPVETNIAEAGDEASTAKIVPIKRSKVIGRLTRRRTAQATVPSGSGHSPNGAKLTSESAAAHTEGQGAASSAEKPTGQQEMAQKPGLPPSYYKLIEDDPTVPKADATLGPPEPVSEPKRFADFSKPEDFPEDVRAIIESAPK